MTIICDNNIKKLISDIKYCMTDEQINRWKNNLIFVNYNKNKSEHGISMYEKDGVSLLKVDLDDFKIIYECFEHIKPKLPMFVLRALKEEIYQYIITNDTKALMLIWQAWIVMMLILEILLST